MDSIRLAVIDDEPTVCQRLKQIFRKGPFEIETLEKGRSALTRMDQKPFRHRPVGYPSAGYGRIGGSRSDKKNYPTTEVILITGYATLDQAVEAVKKGAFYYLAKPFTPDQVRAVVNRAAEHPKLSSENKRLREEVFQKIQYEGIVGISSKIKDLLQGHRQGLSD